MNSPTPKQIKQARETVQVSRELRVTAAQQWCAKQVHSNPRSWQKWEAGDREMHPAFWELFKIKTAKQ